MEPNIIAQLVEQNVRMAVAALALELWALSESSRTRSDARLAVSATCSMAALVCSNLSRCTATLPFTSLIRLASLRISPESLLHTS